MRFKRFVAAIIAAFTAITPLSLNTPEFMPATSFAEEAGDAAKYPDWVPTDYDSAAYFRNIYGATHIEDGYVCVVYKMDYEHYDPEIMIHYLRYQFRKEGDALRTESIEGYTYSQKPAAGDLQYTVMLFTAQSSGSYSFDMIDEALTTSPDTEHPKSLGHYSFYIDSNGNIIETDIYSWLPDSTAEFNEYFQKNGAVSVKDNNVVFCTTTIEQLDEKWEPDSNNKYECFKYLMASDCTMEDKYMYDDISYEMIYVYQAVKDGYEKISWICTSPPIPDPHKPTTYTLTADCVVTDKAWTVLLADTARFIIYDSHWKPVDISKDDKVFLNPDIRYSSGEEGVYASVDLASIQMTENPFYWDISQYKDADVFDVSLLYNNIPEGYTLDTAKSDVRKFDNGAIDYRFKLKESESGDVNGDGEFTVADLVAFKRWLLGTPDAELADWKAADLCSDGKLDVFDFCLMRRLLVENYPKLKNAPAIRDDYGKVTDEQRFTLIDTISKMYPGVDMSDFTFEYSPEHPLSHHFAGPCFYVYYKGVLAHGYGDLGEDCNAYAVFAYKGEPTIELLIDPEMYKEIELFPENMLSEDEVCDKYYYIDHDCCKIIYFDHKNYTRKPGVYLPEVAYLLKDLNGDYEIIIDAVTGEKIEFIPYYVPDVD